MANVVVLGAGLMGRALAHDFCRQGNTHFVRIVDRVTSQLEGIEELIGSSKAEFMKANIENEKDLNKALADAELVVGAVSYKFNTMLTGVCLKKGIHFLDLGGNDKIVENQFSMDEEARSAEVTVIPDCGFAPGLAGILGMHLFRQFDVCDELHLRVGGLPQHPRPPLNYMLVFSIQGLINEYKENVQVIENGVSKVVRGLSGLETIRFPKPFGEMEAFSTSGGVSTLVKTLEGKVKYLDYKTIRFKGHHEKISFLFDMGFLDEENTEYGISPREMTEHVLGKKLSFMEKDVSLMRVWGSGTIAGKKVRKSFQCIDYFDQESGLTSMMRMTAFPTAIIGQMILTGEISERGVIRQEKFVPVPELLRQLKKRNINISEQTREIE